MTFTGIQSINKSKGTLQDAHKTFLLLSEIEKEEKLSQRELVNRLGIALGLVNWYLMNFVTKGFVRVKDHSGNRYTYLLPPRGFTEKSRLAYLSLQEAGLRRVIMDDDAFLQ